MDGLVFKHPPSMSEKITVLLQELVKLRVERKEIKKDLKNEEKIEREEYEDLKKTLRDLKTQVKDYEENYTRELAQMPDYQKLKELLVLKEEEIGSKRETLFKELAQMPQKFAKFEVALGDEKAQIELLPALRLFLNGKEERPS